MPHTSGLTGCDAGVRATSWSRRSRFSKGHRRQPEVDHGIVMRRPGLFRMLP